MVTLLDALKGFNVETLSRTAQKNNKSCSYTKYLVCQTVLTAICISAFSWSYGENAVTWSKLTLIVELILSIFSRQVS